MSTAQPGHAEMLAVTRKFLVSRWAVALLAGTIFGSAANGYAQNFPRSHQGSSPLVLHSTGSFFVGGRETRMSEIETGVYGGGLITVDQMYVQYMVPRRPSRPPIVMVHGATLSGKTYETTPDGRMGWYEYFVRKGFPTYVVDQVGRARSGFNQAPFNNRRAAPGPQISQPNLRRVPDDIAWVRWRFGPSWGAPFGDAQFPTEAAANLAKQTVPDLEPTSESDDANYAALADLTAHLKGAILLGHSQSGRFPFYVALRDAPDVKAIVAIEPTGCNAKGFSDADIAKLSRTPILVVYGDYLDAPQHIGPSWGPYLKDCESFVRRVNAAGGKARLMHLPDLSIRGNSHMIMQDRNNLQIADLIIDWIAQHRR